MSAKATFWAWDQHLKHTTKMVLLALADFNSSRNECYPSADTVAKKTGMSKRQVLREIDRLAAGHYITITKAQGRSNRYHLNITTSDTLSPVTHSHQCHPVTRPVTHSHKSGDTQSPEPKKNLRSNLKEKRGRFQRPTIDEISGYLLEKTGNPDHPLTNTFFDHYESNGWRVGKNPMKNWNAAVNQWLAREKKNGHNRFERNSTRNYPEKLSAVERVHQATRARQAEREGSGGAMEENGGVVWTQMD